MEDRLIVFSSMDVQETQLQRKNFAYCAFASCNKKMADVLNALCDCDFLDLLQILSDKQITIKLQFFDLIFSRFISYFSYFYALKDERQISILYNALNSVYESHTWEQNLNVIQCQNVDMIVDYLEGIKKIFMAEEENSGLLNETSDILSSVYLQDIEQPSFSNFNERLISFSFDSVISSTDVMPFVQASQKTLEIFKLTFPNVAQSNILEKSSGLWIVIEKLCEQAIQLFSSAIYDFDSMDEMGLMSLKRSWIYFMRSHSSGIYPRCLFDRCSKLLGVDTKDKY